MSIHTAVVCGELEHVARLLAEDPGVVAQKGGPQAWEPLLFACYGRLPNRDAADRSLAIATLLLDAGAGLWGLEGRADPAGLPWLALVLMLLGAVQLPLTNGFSRWIERQADDFALALTRDPAAFIGAMERLGRLNLAERRPHWLKEFLLYSHPALDRRIARARGDAA